MHINKLIRTHIMKTPTLLTATLLSLMPSLINGRVVELPQVDFYGSKKIMVRAVEITDTATRVNLSLLNIPGSYSRHDTLALIGKATGTTYPLLRSEGYEIGSEKQIGPSGRFDYVNIYPPIDVTDTIVNLLPPVLKNGASSDIAFGIHLGAHEPSKKYTANIHGRHTGKTGFVSIFECTPRYSSDAVKVIPVDNGEFSATFSTDKPVFYQLVDGIESLGSSSTYCKFTPEGNDLEFEISADKNGEVNSITVDSPTGSATNSYSEYWEYITNLWETFPAVQLRDSLEKNRAYYIPRYYELEDLERDHPEKMDSIKVEWQKFRNMETQRTPEGEAAEHSIRKFFDQDLEQASLDTIMKMRDLAGLFALIDKVWHSDDASAYIDIYRRVYRDLFPGHPYSLAFEEIDNTFEPLPGNPFNDFIAPGFDGKDYRLSELMKGRPALLDLWASWCSPCRAASKSMIPVYNDFAPKGFTIVGVARETATPELAKRVVEKDGYPWLNLIELDDEGGIWALYRRQNAAGARFLIDAEGKIVAVDPTADEVRAYLEENLK